MIFYKIISNMFFVLVGFVALLLIISIFPITGNYKVLVVKSGSMEPTIKQGSIIVSRPSTSYMVGDIITFNADNISITHRIHTVESVNNKTVYTTKGDANKGADKNQINHSQVVGKVILTVPYLGSIVDTVKQPWGFILIIVLPALVIISDEIKKIWVEFKKIKPKKVERESPE